MLIETKARNSNEKHNRAVNDLYHEALLAHHKQPTGYEHCFEANIRASGSNPACGDEIEVMIKLSEDKISDIGFSGSSCAICRASASIMCGHLKGLSKHQALKAVKAIEKHFLEQKSFTQDLSPLSAVFNLPIRQQCAVLPWHTAVDALG